MHNDLVICKDSSDCLVMHSEAHKYCYTTITFDKTRRKYNKFMMMSFKNA